MVTQVAGPPRRITYSFYLLTRDCRRAEDALRADQRPGVPGGYREVATALAAEGVRAFLAPDASRRPPWASALDGQIDELGGLRTQATGMVLVAPVRDRLVAFTFGKGWFALDPDRYEWGFGLQLGARTLARDGLRQTEARRLDATARTRLTSYGQDQAVDVLTLDLEGDWVRRLSGRTARDADGSGGDVVRAADSYQFRGPARLDTLLEEVGGLLDRWSSTRRTEAFAFVDNFRPVQRGSARVDDLDAELVDLLERGDVSALALAPAEAIDPTRVDRYELTVGRRTEVLADLDLPGLLAVLRGRSRRLGTAFDRAKLGATDHDGEVLVPSAPLRRWLVAERRHDDGMYVLNAGRWFVMARRYVDQVEAQVRAIPDVTEELGLPPWPPALGPELTYNQRAAQLDPRLLCLDQQTAPTEISPSTVEYCDLLRDDGTFIHVKRAERSQSLSHLWAQGHASADALLGHDPRYRDGLRALLDRHAPDHPVQATLRPARVVYAVATADERPIHEALFTLAKISLLSYHRALTARLQIPVALAKIPRRPPPDAHRRTRRAHRTPAGDHARPQQRDRTG